ncbi:MAG: hypothetical protein E6J41_23520 [Chloroflexi bacterium]|nr:MAG: hypothetical protein E6J41_23520 [Chloroflexota bacterium]
MARRVFYSFHFNADAWRTGQVRNIGTVEANKPVTDNEWETIKKGGDAAIRQWIDGQFYGKSCAIVLIGAATAGRKWIKYEIEKAWNDGKGLLGIYVHNLKDHAGNKTTKGRNPFEDFTLNNGKTKLSSVVETYDPPYTASTSVYAYIAVNLAAWVEAAIAIRDNH